MIPKYKHGLKRESNNESISELLLQILTRDLGCEPLHHQNGSLNQGQCKLNHQCHAQAARAYASQHQPAPITKHNTRYYSNFQFKKKIKSHKPQNEFKGVKRLTFFDISNKNIYNSNFLFPISKIKQKIQRNN